VDVGQELLDAAFPGVAECVFAAFFRRNGERAAHRYVEVVVKDTDIGTVDDVERTGHRECGDGNAGSEGFEKHQAEGIGAARKNEHIGVGIVIGEVLAGLGAGKTDVRILCLEGRQLWAIADDELGAWYIEIEEGADGEVLNLLGIW